MFNFEFGYKKTLPTFQVYFWDDAGKKYCLNVVITAIYWNSKTERNDIK
jgi:hypothetical protein